MYFYLARKEILLSKATPSLDVVFLLTSHMLASENKKEHLQYCSFNWDEWITIIGGEVGGGEVLQRIPSPLVRSPSTLKWSLPRADFCLGNSSALSPAIICLISSASLCGHLPSHFCSCFVLALECSSSPAWPLSSGKFLPIFQNSHRTSRPSLVLQLAFFGPCSTQDVSLP